MNRLTDTAHRSDQQDTVSQADLQRINQMLDLLRGELRILIDAAVPLAGTPEVMERVLAHLATENPHVQAGLAQLTEIALGMERLEQGQREMLERVGMIGDAQHKQLELQRQSSRENAVLFRELRQVQLVLGRHPPGARSH